MTNDLRVFWHNNERAYHLFFYPRASKIVREIANNGEIRAAMPTKRSE